MRRTKRRGKHVALYSLWCVPYNQNPNPSNDRGIWLHHLPPRCGGVEKRCIPPPRRSRRWLSPPPRWRNAARGAASVPAARSFHFSSALAARSHPNSAGLSPPPPLSLLLCFFSSSSSDPVSECHQRPSDFCLCHFKGS